MTLSRVTVRGTRAIRRMDPETATIHAEFAFHDSFSALLREKPRCGLGDLILATIRVALMPDHSPVHRYIGAAFRFTIG